MENKIEIYRTPEGNDIVIWLDGDTIWLDAHLIAELFGVNRPAIVKHIGNIYESLELEKSATCSILEQVIWCFKYIFDSNELKPNWTISKMDIVQKEEWTGQTNGMLEFPANHSEWSNQKEILK